MKEKIKVLICDDSLLIRKKLSDSVKACCSFAIVVFAREGLEAISAFKLHKPDIVFMDIVLPGRSGIEIVKELIDINPKANIIMVSSVGTKINLMKAMAAGACDFIQKPWEQETIDRIIVKFLLEDEND
jgi:two-component system chemotaxis response regulator CheY